MLNEKLSVTLVSHLRPLSTGSKGQDMEEDSRIPLKITERVRALHNSKLSTKQKVSSEQTSILRSDYGTMDIKHASITKVCKRPIIDRMETFLSTVGKVTRLITLTISCQINPVIEFTSRFSGH